MLAVPCFAAPSLGLFDTGKLSFSVKTGGIGLFHPDRLAEYCWTAEHELLMQPLFRVYALQISCFDTNNTPTTIISAVHSISTHRWRTQLKVEVFDRWPRTVGQITLVKGRYRHGAHFPTQGFRVATGGDGGLLPMLAFSPAQY